jgi:hypothetical protein
MKKENIPLVYKSEHTFNAVIVISAIILCALIIISSLLFN